jgi:hypothetical protein
MAKLSGIRKAVAALVNENINPNTSMGIIRRKTYPPNVVEHYFKQAAGHLEALKRLLPDLYGDFQVINSEPETEMTPMRPGESRQNTFPLRKLNAWFVTLIRFSRYGRIVS